MTEDEAKALASELTGIPLEFLSATYESEVDAFQVTEKLRGGVILLVDQNLGVLFGTSGVNYTKFLEDFRLGMRTDPSRFASMKERKTAWYAEPAVELRVWKKSAEGRVGPPRASK